jgi:hypothetical protein
MTVYLVPAGRNRFELYSESHDEGSESESKTDPADAGWFRRAAAQWHEWVERARRGSGQGRLARWRDAAICRLAETVAEQRTLWALRAQREAVVRFPSTLDAARARATLMDLLAHARRHHQRWFFVDLVLFVASGPVAFIPGPNLLAYYLAFRLVGHVQTWRGARQGMDRIAWTLESDAGLAELASLADVPRDVRASRVEAIAERLNLRRLTAFFDRVAVRSG